MTTQILLEGVTASFVHIAQPTAFNTTQTPKYSMDMIMPPSHPGFVKFWEVINTLATEKWKANGPSMIATIQTANKVCFGDGNRKVRQTTGEVYVGYANNYYISAKNPNRPQIIDISKKAILEPIAWEQAARQIYAGCKVNVVIQPYLQVHDGNGIRCELVAVQFAGDGEPFGVVEIDATPMFANAQAVAPAMQLQPAPVAGTATPIAGTAPPVALTPVAGTAPPAMQLQAAPIAGTAPPVALTPVAGTAPPVAGGYGTPLTPVAPPVNIDPNDIPF